MQVEDLQTSRAGAETAYSPMSDYPGADERENDYPPPFIDPLELESVALVLEHSLQVHTSHHFFCWTQGLLQTLIRHELLICALRKCETGSFHVDSFSATARDPAQVAGLFNQDTALVPHLLKAWERNHFQPIVIDLARESATVDGALAQEFRRLGASEVLVHGTHDTAGRVASLYLFACPPGAVPERLCHLAALLVPSLHSAWVHTQLAGQMLSGASRDQGAKHEILTAREHEILGWIYQGKSNIEIGMILGISPLTVKNHVQKILRRLNVLNRAQAVGKALALRILDSAGPR